MSRSTRLRLALGVIAAAAFALRMAGTEWGKPYAYHFDEPFVVKPALRIVQSGDFNPHFFRYPSLMIYLEAAVAAANHAWGEMPLEVPKGAAYGPSDLGTWTWPALAGGRYAVAVFGTATVVLVGAIAAATGGLSAGVSAALLLACFPLHVEHSHYLTTDVPAAAFVALAFACLLYVRGALASAACAGFALGLGIATKYTAAAALPALLLSCSLRTDQSASMRMRAIAAALAACALAFLAACPYALLDHGTFVAELQIVRDHYGGGHLGAEGVGNWSWYARRLREEGLGTTGFGLLALGATGVVFDVLRPRGSRGRGAWYAAAFLGLALAWFAWLGAVTVRFERNLMPIVVLACAAAGHGLGRLLDAARARSRVAGAVAAAALAGALAWPASISLAATRRLAGADTRGMALEWIDRNVAEGAYIMREEYTPQPDPERFRVEYAWSLGFGDPRDYRRAGVDYVIASQAVYARFLNDASNRYPDIVARYRRIFALPRAAMFIAQDRGTGPVVTIYRVKHGQKRRKR